MSFDTDVAAEKRGVVWLLDISTDDFATVLYRWSTASGPFNSNDYDGRIASITPIERSFGRDHLPVATTTKLRIENTDFLADWLINRETVGSTLLKARFKLTAVVYSTSYSAADSLTYTTQTIGIFVCLDEPEAMDGAIDLTLADDSLGRLAEPLTTPTVRDWADTLFADPVVNGNGSPQPQMDWDVPLPLVFGLGAIGCQVPAYAGVAQYADFEGTVLTSVQVYQGSVPPVKWPIVICAAKSGTQPAGVDEVVQLYGTLGSDCEGRPEMRGETLDIPRFFQQTPQQPQIEIWRPMRSNLITKSGRDWQIVWLEFNVDHYVIWFKTRFPDLRTTESGALAADTKVPTAGFKSAAVAAYGLALNSRGHFMGAFEAFHVRAGALGHLSMVTRRTAEVEAPSQLLIDMIHDAIAYYSKATTADLDTAAFVRAAKARQTVLGAGIIQPARPRPLTSIQRNGWVSPNPRDGIVGVLRTALGEMCASCDVDLFMTKEGLYSVSTNVFDYDAVTTARVDVDEARTSRFRTKTPSDGERWAPYNRVFLQGPGGASYGPYDNQNAIDEWGVIKPVTLQAKWNLRLWGENSGEGASTVWMYRTLESKVRPAIRFLADREYLALELGEYFTATWSRGGQNSVFSGTVFRLEGMRIDPASLAVELSAIWSNDLVEENPYLLDDETLVVRVASSGGRTATVVDGDATVTFSAGNLVSDGVAAGDILVLKDATQAANVFTRYRALRIASVTDATHLEVATPADDPTLDFDAGAGVAVATWEIRRGATTYHTAVSDPTNYPNGGAMYGKASDATFNFSDTTAANKLLDG